ncbi:MAG: hypothetical protein K2K91_09820 [Ruminococcus sp.]|nr:hypothetical protein [Ruminococcus sp.]
MTATNSSKTSFFWTRYLNNLKANKKSLIVNIILNILGLPAMSIAIMVMFWADGKEIEYAVEDGCFTFFVIGFFALSAVVLMGATVAMSQYKYLYKKTITDMNYSLPLNGTQRFFADYLSGLTLYVVPLVISIIVSLIMLGIGQIFIDMNEMWEMMPFMLEIALIVIMAMIQYYSITVFALTFCGNTFEANFSVISFIVMIPATIGCLWLAIIETSGFGITEEAIFTKGIFTSTNPAGAFAFFVQFVDAYDSYDGYKESLSKTSFMLVEWVFTMLVSVAVYVCSAWQLHRFRKAEDVSKPYVYRSFFYAIMTMVVFCILSLFITFNGFIFAGIVICAVIWFVMEIITRRGFKKFWTAGVGFVVSVVSVFAICGICKVTDGFGASKHIPSALSVDYVTIDTGYNDTFRIDEDIRFKDKDVIKEAIALNKDIVDRHFNPQNYSYNEVNKSEKYTYSRDIDINIDLTYSGMTGSKTMRTYTIYSGMADNLVKAILLSDEYAEYSASQLGSRAYHDMQLSTTYNLSLCDSLYNSVNHSSVTERQMNEIRKAYETDMKNMTEDELINGKVYCYIGNYWVLESFENTIKVLDTDIPSIEDSLDSVYVDFVLNPEFKSNFKNYVEKEKTIYNRYYYGYDNYILVDKITSVSPQDRYSYNDDEKVVSANVGKENVMELIKNSTPIIIGEMPLAKVIIGNNSFYIRNTPENVELIEKLDKKNINKRVAEYYDTYGWDEEYT